MTREELRERVAALLNADCFEGCEPGPDEMRACVYPPCRCRTVADAAIAIIRGETLEEAARVADDCAPVSQDTFSMELAERCDMVAAAIRALKEKSDD